MLNIFSVLKMCVLFLVFLVLQNLEGFSTVAKDHMGVIAFLMFMTNVLLNFLVRFIPDKNAIENIKHTTLLTEIKVAFAALATSLKSDSEQGIRLYRSISTKLARIQKETTTLTARKNPIPPLTQLQKDSTILIGRGRKRKNKRG